MTRSEFERRARGLTQHQLADITGVPQTYISLLERGRLVPTETELAKLSQTLGVSPPVALMKPVVAEPDAKEVKA